MLSRGGCEGCRGTLSIRGDSLIPNAISVSLADDTGNGFGGRELGCPDFSRDYIQRINIVGGAKVTNHIVSSLVVPNTVYGGIMADDVTVPDVSTSVAYSSGNDKVTVVSTTARPFASRRVVILGGMAMTP